MDLLELFKNYLLSKKLSQNTVKSYIADLSLFLKFEDFSTTFKELKLEDFRRYFAHRKNEQIKSSSNARAVSAVKSFFIMLKKHNICESSAVFKFTSPKLPKTLPKALKQEEIANLLNPAKAEDINWEEQRNIALITLIYSTGMRVSEALSLHKRDISKNSDFIKVVGKGEKERTIPILKKARDEIAEYLKLSPISLLPDYKLFIKNKRDAKTGKPVGLTVRDFQKIMQKEKNTKGLPSFASPHSLRHSFATHLISAGGDIRSVQEILGHASLSTTQKYVKVDENTLKNAYKKFHPSGD
jgi:integrase/recombinase XerC